MREREGGMEGKKRRGELWDRRKEEEEGGRGRDGIKGQIKEGKGERSKFTQNKRLTRSSKSGLMVASSVVFPVPQCNTHTKCLHPPTLTSPTHLPTLLLVSQSQRNQTLTRKV